MVTYYVVQAFQHGRRGILVADLPIQATDEGHARRVAERLSMQKAGVVAFSRAGDLTTGEFEDARILMAFGQLPPLEGAEVEATEIAETEACYA